MTFEGSMPFKSSIVAGADLSAQVNQYKCVKLNGSGQVIAIAADTDVPIGILQNRPALGDPAEVLLIGESKYQASTAVAIGALLGIDADGQLITLAAGNPTKVWVGRSRTAPGATGVLGTGWFNFVLPAAALTAN